MATKQSTLSLIPVKRVERRILLLRGQKVLLDFQLAELYEVETKAINQAVKRNLERFPGDFMFQLCKEESAFISKSQLVNLNDGNRSQFVTGSQRHRDPKMRPHAFTEQGVAMLSSVLRSERAVQVNIAIMRAFVQVRQMLASNADLARKMKALEKKFAGQFKIVFAAIHQLMERSDPLQPEHGRQIGFHHAPPPLGKQKATKKRRQLS